jgi:hypothetical protein
MTRKTFIDALKGKMNTIVDFVGFKVQNIAYRNDPWILLVGEDKVIETREDYFDSPAKKFHTREELWGYLKRI